MGRYTAEEACELLMNDENFGEIDSGDSLDDSFRIPQLHVQKWIQILKMTLLEELFL